MEAPYRSLVYGVAGGIGLTSVTLVDATAAVHFVTAVLGALSIAVGIYMALWRHWNHRQRNRLQATDAVKIIREEEILTSLAETKDMLRRLNPQIDFPPPAHRPEH